MIPWSCYTRGLVAKDQLFTGNEQSSKIYATHHAPVYLKFSAPWIFNRDYGKPHYQLQVNVKRKLKKFKTLDESEAPRRRREGLPWGGAPGETMLATLRGGIQSLSPCPGGGIQSLSHLRGGPRSPGIQSASDRGDPGNLPGKPGPTGLGPKTWRRPLLWPREATLRDVLHRGWYRTLYGKTTDHRMTRCIVGTAGKWRPSMTGTVPTLPKGLSPGNMG